MRDFWDGYDQGGEKIGIGESVVSNLVTIRVEAQSGCRCCGNELGSHDGEYSFVTDMSFEHIEDWFEKAKPWERVPGWFRDDMNQFCLKKAQRKPD